MSSKERLVIRGEYPAFPGTAYPDDNGVVFYPGISRREYFAAKAMQSLIGWYGGSITELSERAVAHADRLLEAIDRKAG